MHDNNDGISTLLFMNDMNSSVLIPSYYHALLIIMMDKYTAMNDMNSSVLVPSCIIIIMVNHALFIIHHNHTLAAYLYHHYGESCIMHYSSSLW